MTTGLEDKVENAVSHARLGVCPKSLAYGSALYGFSLYSFDERELGWLKWLHWEWLKRNPKVECSCR